MVQLDCIGRDLNFATRRWRIWASGYSLYSRRNIQTSTGRVLAIDGERSTADLNVTALSCGFQLTMGKGGVSSVVRVGRVGGLRGGLEWTASPITRNLSEVNGLSTRRDALAGGGTARRTIAAALAL